MRRAARRADARRPSSCPRDGDRAMVDLRAGRARSTADDRGARAARRRRGARASSTLVPGGTAAYAASATRRRARYAQRLPADARRARALVVNRSEALPLTGAARRRAGRARARRRRSSTAVVTRRRRGRRRRRRRRARQRARRRRGRGAGHDRRRRPVHRRVRLGGSARLPLAERLRWAVVYAALSVTVPTATAGASTRDAADRASGPARARTRRPSPGHRQRSAEQECHRASVRAVAALVAARGAARGAAARRPAAAATTTREGGRGARELDDDRRRQGRRRHADRLGPGGARRPGASDQEAQRAVPAQVPEHQDQPRREVVHRPAGDAQARGLRPEPARRRRGEQRLLGDGPARQGRAAAAARRVRATLQVERPLLDGDPAT